MISAVFCATVSIDDFLCATVVAGLTAVLEVVIAFGEVVTVDEVVVVEVVVVEVVVVEVVVVEAVVVVVVDEVVEVVDVVTTDAIPPMVCGVLMAAKSRV